MNTYTVYITPTVTTTIQADHITHHFTGATLFYKDKELIAVFPPACSVKLSTETPLPPKEGKKIEFVFGMATDRELFNPHVTPSEYKNVELITRNFGDYDLMIAYDDDKDNGVLYLGHYNDGIK